MLLELFLNFADFLENHSAVTAILTASLGSLLWFRNYTKQKRAEAFFDFYTKLMLYAKTLKYQLEDNYQMNCEKSDDGNIYSLIYTDDAMKKVCPRYKRPEPSELNILRAICDNIKNCILTSDNNVYPKKAKRKRWYESQYVLLSFCDFIENDALRDITNNPKADSTPIHITKCTQLKEAIDYIIQSIEKEKY